MHRPATMSTWLSSTAIAPFRPSWSIQRSKRKFPVVVLIHEIYGLSDWAKEMADELAAQGYIVIAPDLLSGFGPNGGGTSEFSGQDAAVKAVSGLNPEGVNADLDAAADYGKSFPQPTVRSPTLASAGAEESPSPLPPIAKIFPQRSFSMEPLPPT